MLKFLHDLFIPHLHNNFRSRLLHHQSLILSIVFLFLGSFVLSYLRISLPQVLGIASDITVQQLLLFTNEKREQNAAGTLALDERLAMAAEAKANNMFSENYWAHNSPSGKSPWVFIKNSGYTYVYAGENLAKGFAQTQDVIKAWMDSPTHRENMLSKNYTDVGFAVKEGKLLGENTILIVEMFGNTNLTQNIATSAPIGEIEPVFVAGTSQKPLLDVVALSKNFVLIMVALFILILLIDMVIVERGKIKRFVGHNLDHIFFFSAIVLIVIIIARGSIL